MRASYPTYKSTSIPWLPEMPEHWDALKAKHIFKERSEKGYPDEPLLAATQTKGVVRKEEYETRTVTAQKDFHLLKLVKEEDFVISLRSFQGGIEYAYHRGIISPAYTIFYERNKVPVNKAFYRHLFKSHPFINSLTLFVTGIREGQNIDYAEFKDSLLPFPPLPEQTAIANYLDAKTEQINRFIAKKEKLIALLKEQKQAVINKAVTKGIKLNVPMKDSGVEWLGDIPSHWKVIKLKYIANAIIGVTYSPNDIVDEQKGILVLRSSNIQNGKLSFLDNVFIKKEISQKLLTQKGDILLCARNGSADLIGKNVCIDDSAVGLTFGAFMTIVRSKYWSYLSWFFNSSIFKSQTGLFATSTINQLTSDTLNNLKIAFPTDSSEREEIIKTLEIETQQIDLGIEKIEKEIEKVKELKQSLIAEVVTGKIKVV